MNEERWKQEKWFGMWSCWGGRRPFSKTNRGKGPYLTGTRIPHEYSFHDLILNHNAGNAYSRLQRLKFICDSHTKWCELNAKLQRNLSIRIVVDALLPFHGIVVVQLCFADVELRWRPNNWFVMKSVTLASWWRVKMEVWIELLCCRWRRVCDDCWIEMKMMNSIMWWGSPFPIFLFVFFFNLLFPLRTLRLLFLLLCVLGSFFIEVGYSVERVWFLFAGCCRFLEAVSLSLEIEVHLPWRGRLKKFLESLQLEGVAKSSSPSVVFSIYFCEFVL